MSDIIPLISAVIGEAASFRPITNAIFTGVSTYLSGRNNRVLKEIVDKVDERVQKLEQRIDQNYIKSDDYYDFVYKTMRMAADDARKEKLNLFANIMVNAALIGNADENDTRKYLYDETIDKIDEKLFGFLLNLSCRRLLDGQQRSKGWRGNEDDLMQLGVDSATFYFNADYLLSVGVLVRLPVTEAVNGVLSYHPEYYVTQYGVDFVEYVRNQW